MAVVEKVAVSNAAKSVDSLALNLTDPWKRGEAENDDDSHLLRMAYSCSLVIYVDEIPANAIVYESEALGENAVYPSSLE